MFVYGCKDTKNNLQSKLFFRFYEEKGRLLSPFLKVFLTDCPIGKRKNEKKICDYENCPYLCSVVWLEGSFALLWLPFLKRKAGCLNVLSRARPFKHKEI